MSLTERNTSRLAAPAAASVRDASASASLAGRPPVLRRRSPHHLAAPGPSRHRPRTAFVLAGGASLGAMQVGMLRALFERGIEPDMLVGTSAGALNAAYVASRPPTVETAKQLAQVWRAVHRNDVFPIHPRTMIGGLASHRDHLVPDRPLRRLISRHLELKRLEHAPVPLHLVTLDLLEGREVLLSDGPAIEAVLAAASIPGVLPPVRWGEYLLVDGGVVNNTPISHAVELGAERIYVLPTDDPQWRGRPMTPQGALDTAVYAFTLLVGARLETDLVRYAQEAELVVLPAANPRRVQPTDFDHADHLIASALHAAKGVLKEAIVSAALAA